MSANAFKTVVDIDLLGTFNVLRASHAYLRKPGASLISITAGQGVRPTMFQAHACAAKAGINLLTQTLAMEWGPAGIRVNAISPGPIGDTEGMKRLAPDADYEARLKGRIPLRDYGTKRDVADMAVFLSSDNAVYVTGAVIDCDGGSILGDASADAPPSPNAEPLAGGWIMQDDTNFSGKNVLVVGGSSGIGNGIAHGFRERGAAVHVWGTRAAASDYDAAEGSDLAGLKYDAVDAGDPDAIGRGFAVQPTRHTHIVSGNRGVQTRRVRA